MEHETLQPSQQRPSVGRIVHYSAYNGVCLAALITGLSADGTAHLAVFTSLPNVNGVPSGGIQFHFGVGEGLAPGRWHWPERV